MNARFSLQLATHPASFECHFASRTIEPSARRRAPGIILSAFSFCLRFLHPSNQTSKQQKRVRTSRRWMAPAEVLSSPKDDSLWQYSREDSGITVLGIQRKMRLRVTSACCPVCAERREFQSDDNKQRLAHCKARP